MAGTSHSPVASSFDQWFSTQGSPALQGTFGNIWMGVVCVLLASSGQMVTKTLYGAGCSPSPPSPRSDLAPNVNNAER